MGTGRELTRILKPGDFVVVGFLLIATVISFACAGGMLASNGRKEMDTVTVTDVKGTVIWRSPLSREGVFCIDGDLGSVYLEVKGMRVRVKESSCPEQHCVKQGWIDTPDKAILCVPNGLVIRLGSEKADQWADIDAVVR